MNISDIILPGLKDKTAVITGAGGAICGAIARSLASAGARVAIWDMSTEAGSQQAVGINDAGGRAAGITCDVTKRDDVERAAQETIAELGEVDILINGAGGSRKEATTSPNLPFFDIALADLMNTIGLNYAGTVLPCQAIGRGFAARKRGVILNVASVGGVRPLTRAIGYSNAKAAVVSFTQWLAVHMAREYDPRIRVNALAPGFVLTDQNRFLLVDEKTGKPTDRGNQIAQQVPMGRYGEPGEMVGAALWLVSDAATYVTGAVVPVDGGLLASLGV